MRKLLAVLVALSLTGMGIRAAEGGAEAIKQQMNEMKTKARDLNKRIATIKRKFAKDEEVLQVKQAMDEARKAYEEKLREKVASDPEGQALLQEEETLKQQQAELTKQLKELKKQDKPAKKPKKGEGEDAPEGEDAEG